MELVDQNNSKISASLIISIYHERACRLAGILSSLGVQPAARRHWICHPAAQDC
jgi:hypothetical protein